LPRHGEGQGDGGDGDHGHGHGGDDGQGHGGNCGGPRSATPAAATPAAASPTGTASGQISPAISQVLPGGTITAGFPGTIRSDLFTRLQGAELNGTINIDRSPGYSFDLLGGFRWVQLSEGLDVFESDSAIVTATGLNGQPNGITSTAFVMDLSRQEQFRTQNNFYGGQLAARVEFIRNHIFVNVLGKLGLGDVHEEVTISGTGTAAGGLTLTSPAGAQTTPFSGPAPGWLAQATNIGTYRRDCFAVLPEATVRLGYEFTRNLRASLGYTFLYCSEVVRPGDQIDPVQGTGHPLFTFRSTDFWAQGVDAQVEFRY
jgi:hypothetical protein